MGGQLVNMQRVAYISMASERLLDFTANCVALRVSGCVCKNLYYIIVRYQGNHLNNYASLIKLRKLFGHFGNINKS